MQITASVRGGATLVRRLQRLQAAAGETHGFLEAAGRVLVDETHQVFRDLGPGWPPPRRRDGEPLRDTGQLANSITYGFRRSGRTLVVGSNLEYAGVQQYGARIVPTAGKKWLAIPVSPPLNVSQRRTAKPRDFPEAFVLIKGPEGPGLYRRATRAVAFSRFSRGVSKHAGGKRNAIERIFAFRKSVRITARPYLKWTPRAVARVKRTWIGMIARAGGRS